jgi:hypothetical protein
MKQITKSKFLFIGFFLLLSACEGFDKFGCFAPTNYDKNLAEEYYQTLGTSLLDEDSKKFKKIKKKFFCYYKKGDKIYVYKTFFGEKYILVRRGAAITYVE